MARSYQRFWSLLALLALVTVTSSSMLVDPDAGRLPDTEAFERTLLDEARSSARLHAEAARLQAEQTRAADGPDSPASIEDLRARVAEVLAREGVPGVGLAVVDEQGVRWAGGVGLADVERGRPVDADTAFRVGSITKSLVALAVMRLVERGRLDLHAPMRALVPDVEFDNPWAEQAPITLAHVLEHSAGFDDMRFNEWFADDQTTPAQALAINPRSRVARWRPGSRMSYANPGYTMAGRAIEVATGEPWDRVVTREVLEPMGMPAARLRRDESIRARLAVGYEADGRPIPFAPIAHKPAGSLMASPRELGELVHFWLRRGERAGRPRIVGPASLDRIERSETLPYALTDEQYGLGNYGDVSLPAPARGHDGGLPGFASSYQYFPEFGVGYVALFNASHSPRAVAEVRALLFAYLSRGRALPEPPPLRPDPEAIAAAAGYYELENPRVALLAFIVRIFGGVSLEPTAEGARIEALLGGELDLVSTGEGGLRHPSHSGTSLRLTQSPAGERIIVSGMAYFEAGSRSWASARLWLVIACAWLIRMSMFRGLGLIATQGIRRFRDGPLDPQDRALHNEHIALVAWPAAAGLCFWASVKVVGEIAAQRCFGTLNPWTMGLCLATLAFALCSGVALTRAIRSLSHEQIPGSTRALSLVGALACFAMTVYLASQGIIGLRLWAW
ncbi:beta-lactamase family protein [Pseudenhygromyxa sp. WMMC2535]|uniref:serine hydrolase domain-containing protein n=1 Tax=Pseudenhygromyxa sp. WMMC2535 TaxID=2712867 RepID=UPI001553301D|nr:serine hydrolase domain-containing protein [Pseudenhygromyxa sp. WMMC2535]NVB37127.1 beta-lactamase family protein [Pseudenhygromyxa sp. WMMC2535]